MTTPSGAISMNDVRNETGDTGSISFSDWFVRQVSKSPTGPVALSGMRGKTCHPGNSPGLGINYVSSATYSASGNRTLWIQDKTNNQITIVRDNNTVWSAVSSTAALGYIDVGNVRYFRGTLMSTVFVEELYSIRWVEG